jgi:hypothetical protein
MSAALLAANAGLAQWLGGAGTDGRAAVGQVYRAQAPAESDSATLLRLLAPPAFASADQCAAWVRGQVAADFAAGRIVVVRRWLLSVTEARLCALGASIRS